jgi:signal peptidase I
MQILGSIFEFVKTVIAIVLIAFFVRFFLFQPFVVEGSSMEPNFHNSEYLLVNKLTYRMSQPKRGDVIVFHPPTSPGVNYIKRIIATPGETVEVKDGMIFVNNTQINEPYIPEEKTLVRNSQAANLKATLGQNEYFVLGDNRDHSSDSREWGSVPRENIIGKAWVILFPVKNFGLVFHPSYVAVPGSVRAAR